LARSDPYKSAMCEYKDLFRLRPIMPIIGNLDPKTLKKTFEKINDPYKDLDWEIEDLLSEQFFNAFLTDYPDSVAKETKRRDKIHRDLTRDGKAHLHQFINKYAILKNLDAVVSNIQALRFYLSMKN